MLNSLADAIETLLQAGAVKYTISQPGQLKMQNEADTADELVDLFQKDWNRLSGGVYKVDFAKTKNDNKSNLCFRINKAPEPAAAVGGFGAAVGDVGQVLSLQQQIWQLQAASQMRDLQDQHREAMEALKAKYEKQQANGAEIGLDSIGGIVAGIDKVHNIMLMAKGHAPVIAPAAVAGAPSSTPQGDAAGYDQAATDRLATALQSLAENIGEDAVLGALETLASKAQANPEKVKSSLGYLNML